MRVSVATPWPLSRRDLIAGLGVAVVPAQIAIADQVKVIGVLAPGPLRPIESFKKRLNELGWVEHINVRFEERWGEDDDTRYLGEAKELVQLRADAILTWSTPAVLAAKRATTTIPIVMATVGDPVAVGAVASLARPAGNITGFSSQNFELEEKRFELLRQLVPDMRSMAMLGRRWKVAIQRAIILAGADEVVE